MKFDYKGEVNTQSKIIDFIEFIKELGDNALLVYKGLIVNIDPTVDYRSENILIRWIDIEEGFNEKKIYSSLAEFKRDFQLYHA